jgi:hypothetical protein
LTCLVFFNSKIGEYAYGFTSDSEEEIGGDSITVYGSTIIADAADFLRAFPQYRLDDYLYRLSVAQIQFMAIDNTHTKYLKGRDKKAWNDYKDAYEAQQKLDRFYNGCLGKYKTLKAGEEYEIPVKKG